MGFGRQVSTLTCLQRAVYPRIASNLTTLSRGRGGGGNELLSDSSSYQDRALLRHLLRECSYFPDECARKYLRTSIITSFRDCKHKTLRYLDGRNSRPYLTKWRSDGRSDLHTLQKANAGDWKPLLRVLTQAYGRLGRKRRVLLNELIAECQSDTTAIDLKAPRSTQWRTFIPRLSPRMTALAKAQSRVPEDYGILARVRPLRTLKPNVPDVNSWHRPTPMIRVKHISEEWWSDFLSKLIPPLPTRDWVRMYDIASGNLELTSTRQSPACTVEEEVNPIDTVLKPANERIYNREEPARCLKPRTLRRAFTTVFQSCPHIDWNHEQQAWQVIWGYQALSDRAVIDKIRKQHSLAFGR